MSDTIKKIEGFANVDTNAFIACSKETASDWNGRGPFRHALLLVSTDDKVPEVITKDQVSAMLAEVMGETPDQFKPWIRAIAAKHGITL